MNVERVVADMQLPRRNGELVFDAPWESRAFGLVVALHERGLYRWDDFQARLVEEIAAGRAHDGSGYYEQWLASCEGLLLERGVVTETEIAARAAELAAEDEHGHDHDHDHDHGHDH